MKKIIFVLVLLFLSAIFPQSDSSKIIRVMTYNIHHGEGIDNVIDISRIAQLILDNNIDIACLQEVDKEVERTNKIDIPKLLAEQTGMNYSFHKNINYQGGEYGNCTLSKYPIVRDTNHHFTMLREGEQRGLLQSVINFEGFIIAVMNTHLDYRADDAERILSVERIIEEAKKYSGMPIIICGDFNDIPESRTYLKMTDEFIDAGKYLDSDDCFTYPTEKPEKRIDYVFLGKPGEQNSEATIFSTKLFVLESVASDHLPVIAEFEIKKKTGID